MMWIPHHIWNLQEGEAKMTDKLKILRVLNKQLEHLRDNPDSSVSCILLSDLEISYHFDCFVVCFSYPNHIDFNGPNWLEIGTKDGNATFTFPENYLFEFVSFLYECYNNKSVFPTFELIDHVITSLHTLRLRWIPGSEPLSEIIQQRLLGELAVIVNSITIMGSSIINSWDSDGRALHDFENSDYIIEAKATTTSPERIGITSLDQLQDRTKPTFLSVTNVVKNSKDSSFFHEIVEGWLLEIKSRSENDYVNLQILLNSIGYNTHNLSAYRTKWRITSTRLIPIDEKTPLFPLDFSNKIPKEVEISGYRLHTEHLESIDFESLQDYIIRND